MKKILLLLLLTVASYGQTIPPDATPIENVQITNNVQNDTLTKVGMFTQDGVLDYMPATSLPVSTATTNALDLKTTLSAGAFSGFAVTNNGDGTISVGSGIAYLRATNDQYAPLIKYPIAAYNNIPLVDNLNNYIVVSYNGGSPALVLNTTGTGIDTQTTSIAVAAARVGTTVHYVSLVGSNSDPNAKLRNRYLQSEGIRRVSGLAISATGRKIATTAGITYSGLIRLDVAAMNTNTSDTYTLAYNNGSTWTRVTGQTDINNTQYNNSGTLTALNNNNFRTDYIYALVNSPSKLYVILGNTQYNSISAARLAPTPSSLPVELQQLGVLVGRAIIEKDAVTMEISSPFTQDFAAGAVESHNDLSGLQGGTSGEYNHLTNAQVTLVDGSEQTANKQNSLATDGTGVKFPTVDAINEALIFKKAPLFTGSSVIPVYYGDSPNLDRSSTFYVNKPVTLTNEGWHTISTYSDISQTSSGSAHASIDVRDVIVGSGDWVHGIGGQFRPVFNGSGTMSQFSGIESFVRHEGSGVVTNAISHSLLYPQLTGSGSYTNIYGLKIADYPTGYSIYTGTGDIRFGGETQFTDNVSLGDLFTGYSGYQHLSIGSSSKIGLIKFKGTYNGGDGAEISQLPSGDVYIGVNSGISPIIIKPSGVELSLVPTAPTATAGTNTTQIATTAFVQNTVTGGSFTPTLSNALNISSSSLTNATYTKIGNVVTVNIGYGLTPTSANSNTQLKVTLPVARSVSTQTNVGVGSISDITAGGSVSGAVQTDANTTEAILYFKPLTTNSHSGSMTFQYNLN